MSDDKTRFREAWPETFPQWYGSVGQWEKLISRFFDGQVEIRYIGPSVKYRAAGPTDVDIILSTDMEMPLDEETLEDARRLVHEWAPVGSLFRVWSVG